MKGSQVAGLVVGWLAVALSMAAIGTAAVDRVGVYSSRAQAQITVTRPVTVGIPSAPTATQTPQALAPAPSVSASEPNVDTAALAEYVKPVVARTTSAPAGARVTVTAPQPTAASSRATATPVVEVPHSEVLVEEGIPTTTTPATATPTTVKTTKKPTSIETALIDQVTASGSLVADSISAWRHHHGATWAGCRSAAPPSPPRAETAASSADLDVEVTEQIDPSSR